MAVAESLLVALLEGPAYGLQLHDELARRTGARRTLNAGQLYRTLDRLERDGLVESRGTNAQGQQLRQLTETGREAAHRWLAGVDAPGSAPWDETIDRVLLAAGNASRLAAVLTEQYSAWLARAEGAAGTLLEDDTPATLVGAAEALRADAMLQWLTRVESSGVKPPEPTPRPPRGRPRQPTRSP